MIALTGEELHRNRRHLRDLVERVAPACQYPAKMQLPTSVLEKWLASCTFAGGTVDVYRIAGADYLHGGRWGKHGHGAGPGPWQLASIDVVFAVPNRDLVADDDGGSTVGYDKYSGWQTVPGRAMLGPAGPLTVQLRIDVLGVRRCANVGFGP